MKFTQFLAGLSLFVLVVFGVHAQSVTTLVTGQGGLDGISVGPDGAVYVSQPNSNRVLRIVDGTAETFLTGLAFPLGSVFDADGNFYVSSSQRIVRRTPAGDISTFAAGFSLAAGLTFGPDGTLYAADYNRSTISAIAADGSVSTFSSGGELDGPAGVAVDSDGRLYSGNFNDGSILRYDSNGNQTLFARPDVQTGYIAIGNDDTLYATMFDGNRVVAIDPDGQISRLAGNGQVGGQDGEAAQAQFRGTNGIIVSPDSSTVYVSEFQAGGGLRAIALDTFEINQGASGAWFYPTTTGSGLLLDVDPMMSFLFAAWFTYADDSQGADGSTRWFTASGNYVGNEADLTLFESSGGRFDQASDVATVAVGTMRLEFTSCNEGTVSYALDGGASGDFPITRVIPGTEALCEALAQPSGN